MSRPHVRTGTGGADCRNRRGTRGSAGFAFAQKLTIFFLESKRICTARADRQLDDSESTQTGAEPAVTLQGYLAHKKPPPPLGPPQDRRHSPTVGS